MLGNQNEEPNPYPDWTSSSELKFWEPDRLYIEWITFLYAIWEKVDYL
ncbi:MAG: hypothetical protein ACFFCT_11485 [Candidatus Odinarchaeota archaeon]|nr:hypothetical protein [Candidatus Thorarchaeota archaeon]